ncbi:MAG: hypothetical protein J6R80_04105 [Kiritimatiellae bacterium]|nr:hypothetical protein [Kiritimatiellia bacterium]
MRKSNFKALFASVVSTAALFTSFAQEMTVVEPPKLDDLAPVREEGRRQNNVWPAFFAVCEYPAASDVAGLRLTIPFSTRQENVTGIDLGLWGRSMYFEGFMINVIRNDVKDDMSGIQIGLYNSAGGCGLVGLQVGLWNESGCFRGVQAGLVNTSGESRGLQVGLINRSETLYGYQVGLVNIIRDAELKFCPVINIGF